MKILVISDTHGELGRFYEIYRSIENIDLVVHLGDYQKDALDIKKHISTEVVSVKGNMDGATSRDDGTEFIETPIGTFLLTHGHMDGVNMDLTGLFYRGKEAMCRGAFFGHTHIPYMEDGDDFMLLNPGSLTRPRDGSNGSYALLEITEESIKCDIIYYKKPYKAKGGYIKGLINYSDRF